MGDIHDVMSFSVARNGPIILYMAALWNIEEGAPQAFRRGGMHLKYRRFRLFCFSGGMA
jgi:hypothetical protein